MLVLGPFVVAACLTAFWFEVECQLGFISLDTTIQDLSKFSSARGMPFHHGRASVAVASLRRVSRRDDSNYN